MNAIVNFAQIVKKATCLMTITQYNSNNSLTPELKWTSFEKINNLDQLINIPTTVEKRSMIQILLRTQDPIITPAQSGGIRVKNYSRSTIHDPLCFQHPPIRSICRTNPQSVRFLRPNLSIRKPIHPQHYCNGLLHGLPDCEIAKLQRVQNTAYVM